MAQYTSYEVAQHILRYCTGKNKPIILCQLQRILYLSWIDYYKATSKYLFDDDIKATVHSVRISDVYHKLCRYEYLPIPMCDGIATALSIDDEQLVNASVDLYYCEHNLMERIAHDDGAWALTVGMRGLNAIIPYETIIRLECQGVTQ